MLNIILITFIGFLSSKSVIAEFPRFRILAPQLICPKDDHSPIDKPDNTVITVQTNTKTILHMDWTVRWQPLNAPSQRFTLLVWRTVRALEAKLNGPQPEPLVYVIFNDELLYGINYIFNVTAVTSHGQTAESKLFYINNTFGEQTLEAVDGLSDMLSVVLIGSQLTFTDIPYVLEAVVTTCVPFYDYHFSWNVESAKESLNITTVGSRLEISPLTLQAGEFYDVTCSVIKETTGIIITQIELPLQVGYRDLEVYLNADKLVLAVDKSFTVDSTIINHDYSNLPLTYHWQCFINEMVCDFLEDVSQSSLIISSGFPTAGRYEITLTVSVLHQSAKVNITITVLDSVLPIIQMRPTPRLLNEGSTLILVANASNVSPMCSLNWYFATEDQLTAQSIDDTCDESLHGTPISDGVTVFSLDENFLYDLADFTNDTQWREVTAEMKSAAGRARFVVECNCSLAFDCAYKALVYADVYFKLNEGPAVGDVTVSPSSGTALETIFRVSSRPAADLDGPLLYNFYCDVGNNNSLLLGSYLEYFTMETFLPYTAAGTEVWVEVCDVRGACSNSDRQIIKLLKGAARSLETLKMEISAHMKRCEIMALQRIAIPAIVTFKNAGQTEALTVFTTFLFDSVPMLAQRCSSQNEQYLEFLNKLPMFGLDTSCFF